MSWVGLLASASGNKTPKQMLQKQADTPSTSAYSNGHLSQAAMRLTRIVAQKSG
jgi:hypothetical protein